MILKELKIHNNKVYCDHLSLSREDFESQIKKPLNKIGGKWDKKEGCFIFPLNPSFRISQLIEGKNVNLKSDFHYFPTPLETISFLFTFAEENGIKWHNHITGNVLEPSAGNGNMIKQLRINGAKNIHYCELMEENNYILDQEIKRLNIPAIKIGDNFEEVVFDTTYDLIMTNPPFRREHIHLNIMFNILKSGGCLFGIFSPKNYESTEFNRFIDERCSKWAMVQLDCKDTNKAFDECVVLVCQKR